MEIWRLLVALIIGAVIGLERESQDKQYLPSRRSIQQLPGVRTFSLLAVLGAISGMMFEGYFPIFILISAIFGVTLSAYYILNTLQTKDSGFTTELAILYSYIIGLLIAIEIFPIQVTLAISVVLTLILSRKKDISTVIKGIQREEFHAFVSYALIALVVLPFLPDRIFSLSDMPGFGNLNLGNLGAVQFFNPFKLWLIVVLVTGIDMVGYALERTVGKRGKLLASIVGGFISSTATTISLAQESKKVKKGVNFITASAVFANAASFIPMFILISVTNASFLPKALPVIAAITLAGIVTGVFFYRKRETGKARTALKNIKGVKESEIFAIVPALKFAFIYLLVTIVTQVGLRWFGQAGFMVASSLAALTGTDAATINISQQASKTVSMQTAVFALILMNGVNLLAKSVYSFLQGSREFAVKFSIAVTLIIATSLVGLLFV